MRRKGYLSGLAAFSLFSLLYVGYAQFSFSSFDPNDPIQRNGSAYIASGHLVLTPASGNQAGSAYYQTKQSLSNGFSTTFRARFTNPGNGGADGIAFIVQSSDLNLVGSNGGGIGYSGFSNFVIEFDTWENGSPLDRPGTHIAVMTRWNIPNSSAHNDGSELGFETLPFDLDPADNSGIWDITITYTPSGSLATIDVTLAQVNGSNSYSWSLVGINHTLFTAYILDGAGDAWVGFTAATGAAWNYHAIESWSFVPEPASLLALGCGLTGLLAWRRRRV